MTWKCMHAKISGRGAALDHVATILGMGVILQVTAQCLAWFKNIRFGQRHMIGARLGE
jgi:hypothetical protein